MFSASISPLADRTLQCGAGMVALSWRLATLRCCSPFHMEPWNAKRASNTEKNGRGAHVGSPPLLVSMPTPMIAVSAATHVVQDTWQHRGRLLTNMKAFTHGQHASYADCDSIRAVGWTAVHVHLPRSPLPLQQLPVVADTSTPLLRSCCV